MDREAIPNKPTAYSLTPIAYSGIVADKVMHRSLKPNHVSSILTGPTKEQVSY